jgi:hypothetical protein
LADDPNPLDLLQIDLPSTAYADAESSRLRDADLLKHLRVASPCDAAWDAMEGDDLVRFCQHCRKNVYNLSGMSQREAAAFVRETEGRLCVRFYRRADGTLLTDDCPVGLRAARRWLLAQIGAVAGTFGLLGIGLLSVLSPPQPQFEHHDPHRYVLEGHQEPREEMGDLIVPAAPSRLERMGMRHIPASGPGRAVDVKARVHR